MRVVAVDLGATSVRVAAVDFATTPVEPVVVHRWPHAPLRASDGSLRWDWDGIVREIRRGLDLALDAGPAASIGVDGWGVDYGLIDESGRLLSPPFSYRDARTADWEAVADRLGRATLYARSGAQLIGINTIFQVAAHPRAELERAAQLLLLPDLLIHELTGFAGAERSNASTTGLLEAATGEWAGDLIDAIGVPRAIFPPVVAATTRAGSYRDVPVHLVGSHDTASAFVAVPGVPGPRSAIVSSGTWVLVGAERAAADTSEKARAANFSNERGALGGMRFLKNVMGFWLLEQCRAAWGSPPIEDLVAAAAAVPGPVPLFDATDARFLAPHDMESEIRAACGIGGAATRALITRCILESIAAATAHVVDELGAFLGGPVSELLVVGGAARMPLMNDLYATATGLPVRVGSPEATALGNAMVQAIALGVFPDLSAARAAIALDTNNSISYD